MEARCNYCFRALIEALAFDVIRCGIFRFYLLIVCFSMQKLGSDFTNPFLAINCIQIAIDWPYYNHYNKWPESKEKKRKKQPRHDWQLQQSQCGYSDRGLKESNLLIIPHSALRVPRSICCVLIYISVFLPSWVLSRLPRRDREIEPKCAHPFIVAFSWNKKKRAEWVATTAWNLIVEF